MANMTWRELKNFINARARKNQLFLDEEVQLYDFSTGEEYNVGTTEMLCGEDEAEDGNNTNWVAYLTINEGVDDEDTEEEASIAGQS